MHKTISNLENIKKKLVNCPNAKIIAVSKTFGEENIKPLLDYGHKDFGENKVQEALQKWPNLKKKYMNINLHMIGKLQTNKVKFLFPHFNYIHSLDNLKLAEKISKEESRNKKKFKIFIQVNLGSESQKNGISIKELPDLYKQAVERYDLNIIGLMCLPPQNEATSDYFKALKNLNIKFNLKELSMGMSQDYLQAANNGATYLRIGSSIFGNRF
ncbi:YggS family pyridoxal phosphate-dependent enzyme [Candidatus Pelagibacter bacterium nBUS_25]|uniref:YggS family pyridoxal phosphate-dependent enzyme n=1 Tax=Candidatus Pelagibacter bacterium nBUS_25 TaxID=3374187 RepID=UPI003EC12351